MDIKTLSRKTTDWAQNIPEICAVILFGSRARGTEKESSDWDICCVLNSQVDEGWYGTWLFEEQGWKTQFCEITGLPESEVQFVSSTSDQVVNGLLEGSRVLYVHRPSSN